MNGDWASHFLEHLGRISAQAAVLVLVILLTQRLFRRWLTPCWCCALWLLVVGRIVLPVSLPTQVSVFNVIPLSAKENAPPPRRDLYPGKTPATQMPAPAAEVSHAHAVPTPHKTQKGSTDLSTVTHNDSTTHISQAVAVTPALQHRGRVPWPLLLFAAWLAGAVGLATHVIIASVRLARRFRGLPEISDPEVLAALEACCSRMRVRRKPRLVEGMGVRSPALHGVFRPRLLLPIGFTRSFSVAELHLIFLHELAHVKRRDVLMNWIVALVQIVHWFNPLLWFGFMRWRADRELACDAIALEAAGEDRNRDYGRTILRLLEGFTDRVASPGLVGILEEKRQLQQRIGMIASFVPRKRGSPPAVLLFVTVAMVGLTDGQTTEPRGKPAADRNDVPRLILEGTRLHSTGNTNLAEAKWRTALELDPDNEIARDYLKKIGRTNLPAGKSIAQFTLRRIPDPFPRTNVVKPSEGRKRIVSMLDSIHFDSVAYDGLPLGDVIKVIYQEVLIRDPARKGINFLISTTVDTPGSFSPTIDPLNGLPLAGADLVSTIIRVAPAQKNITLRQLLDILVLVADRPIKYSVTEFGVVIKERGPEQFTLYTRWYKIGLETLKHGLTAGGIETSNTKANTSPDITLTMLHDYFESMGVDLRTPPKSLIFADRLGMLMVRATLADFDIFEQAIKRLNLVAPQVLMEAMICEMSDDSMKALGFDWIPNIVPNSQSGAPTNVLGAWKKSVLTPQQHEVVMQALKQREDAKVLSNSKTLTESGRQGQIKPEDVNTIVTHHDLDQVDIDAWSARTNFTNSAGPSKLPKKFELGPVLDLVPTVAADGQTIQMTVTLTLKEFVGYDLSPDSNDNWDYVESPGANPAPARPPRSQPTTLPIFRLRQAALSATVFDGQTLVLRNDAIFVGTSLGGETNKDKVPMFDDLPGLGRLFRKESTVPKRKNILFLITPNIIDPAGNHVHSDEDIPARTNSVPAQSPKP